MSAAGDGDPAHASMGLMRAIVLPRVNAPLVLEKIPIPIPKAGEVLIRVAACGVCHTDLHVIKGEVAFPTPAVLGHEISGAVVATGSGTRGVREGSGVVCSFIMPCGTCEFCAQGRDDLCETFFALNRLKGQLYDGMSRLARADGTALAMYSMGGLASSRSCRSRMSSRFPRESLKTRRASWGVPS